MCLSYISKPICIIAIYFMVVFPHCKINLGLDIISKREDGYHAIDTVFYPVPWTDVLEIIPSRQLLFTSSGAIIPGKEEDNLCLKAYHLIRKDFDIGPVNIHLHKIIPTGAGLGGGSSDAAYTLRVLNEIFELQLDKERLQNYASRIGSDCAFFIQNEPMRGSGRGEVLQPVSIHLKGKYMVIIKPEVHVSTAEAYAGVVPQVPSASLMDRVQSPIEKWGLYLKNDFEKTVLSHHPAIARLKEQLYSMKAVYASMSGSGSSVFGIFNEEIKTDAAWERLAHWSGWLL